MADLEFYFDPVCPFAWMTSKWVREVARQRDYDVEWRFISLRLVNAEVDYATHFPAGYERGHTAGLELLRVAAAVRNDHGGAAVGALYAAYGAEIFDSAPGRQADLHQDPKGFVSPILAGLGLPVGLAAAVSDTAFDTEIRAETERALALTGRDVGTPILHFEPPEGTAPVRPGHQPAPEPRRRRSPVGPRRRPRRFRRVRRAEAIASRDPPVAGLRGRRGRGRSRGGLAGRPPP
jgi:2-hydroxychromene-2-carboxylate isomerase